MIYNFLKYNNTVEYWNVIHGTLEEMIHTNGKL